MPISHSNHFNLIRLIAAILVWYGHCYILRGYPDPLLSVTSGMSLGTLCVSVFFVISGYCVSASYERQANWLVYLKNRALRIFPAMIVVLLLCVLVVGPITTSLLLHDYFLHPQTWRYFRAIFWVFPMKYDLPSVFNELPVHLVNGSLWTLHPEFNLYCALAIFGWLGIFTLRNGIILLLTLWCCRTYGLLAHHEYVPHIHLFNYWSWSTIELHLHWSILFVSGCVMYLARQILALNKPLFFLCLAVMLVACNIPYTIGGALFDSALPYVVLYLGSLKYQPIRTLQNRDYSYGIYLYAYPVQQLTLYLFTDIAMLPMMIISFLVTIFCAVLSWHCVEKPALSLKK